MMAIYYEEGGKGDAVVIPMGAEVFTDDLANPRAASDPSRLVPVEWNGKAVSVFLVDLLDRGERVATARG